MSHDHSDNLLSELAEVARDEQEPCVHCGVVWYKTHHKDGLCHKCQADGRPGRAELNWKQLHRKCLVYLLSLTAVALLIYYFFPQGMEWYNGLTQEEQPFVYVTLFSGLCVGVFGGLISVSDIVRGRISLRSGVFTGYFGGVLCGIMFGGACSSASIGLSSGCAFCVSYFSIFFLIYLIKEIKESLRLQRVS